MKNKLMIQYKKKRFINSLHFSGESDRSNKIESVRCTSLKRATEIASKRHQRNIKHAYFYDSSGDKHKVKMYKSKKHHKFNITKHEKTITPTTTDH